MKRDSHERLLLPDEFFLDYCLDFDAEVDELNIRRRLTSATDTYIDRDTVMFGTTFVLMFCFITTLIITSVEAGLVA